MIPSLLGTVQKHASSTGLRVGGEDRDGGALNRPVLSAFPRGESRSVWTPAMELLGRRGLGAAVDRAWPLLGCLWAACLGPA